MESLVAQINLQAYADMINILSGESCLRGPPLIGTKRAQ
jgi:hypothetical protein